MLLIKKSNEFLVVGLNGNFEDLLQTALLHHLPLIINN